MRIQPCLNQSLGQRFAPNFRGKKTDEYYTYISDNSNAIITTSVIGGTILGTLSARKNFEYELVPKVFQYIGAITLGLFGIASANFLLNKK